MATEAQDLKVLPPWQRKRPVVYISGPMTGLPEFNLPAFRTTKAALVALGFDVLSPADVADTEGTGKPRAFYMRRDIEMLLKADAILLLDGWNKSKGALLEFDVAHELGLLVITGIGP
jgi:nucleoside 2-deoxyribosyltransferase